MIDELRLHRAARMISDALYSDSHIPTERSFPALLTSLRADGRLPSEEEVEALLFPEEGNADAVAVGIEHDFRHTVTAIEEMF